MRETALRVIRDSLRAFRLAPATMLAAWIVVEATTGALLAPIASWATNWLISTTGRYAVANEDIVRFALTPAGAAAIFVGAVISLLGVVLARASILRLASRRDGATTRRGLAGIARESIGALVASAWALPRLTSLIARQLVLLLLLASPFFIVIGLVAWFATRDAELYWVVTVRPTRFWVALAIIGTCAIAMLATVVPVWLRWSLALPLCVLEGRRPRAAMRESAELMRGRLRVAAAARLGWFIGVNLLAAGALSLVYAGSVALLSREAGSLTLTAALAGLSLLAHGAILALEAITVGVGDALLVHTLWRRARPEAAANLSPPGDNAPARARAPLHAGRAVRLAAIGLGALALVVGASSAKFLLGLRRPLDVELTAHRGASSVAPENTLAAILAAGVLGADRIEIDVMLSSDSRAVVFHDTDLRRMANDPRRVADMTLAELREIDVGSWFDPAFASERIPTLEEVLDAMRDAGAGATLNIELKTGGDPDRLASVVAKILRERGDTTSIVTSLSTRALVAMRREDPDRRLGAIVSAAVGDVFRLDVDLFAVPVNRATSSLLAASARAGRQVHVWTVSDPEMLTNLALRGVHGVMTNDVEPMRARLHELNELEDLERRLLACRARLLE